MTSAVFPAVLRMPRMRLLLLLLQAVAAAVAAVRSWPVCRLALCSLPLHERWSVARFALLCFAALQVAALQVDSPRPETAMHVSQLTCTFEGVHTPPHTPPLHRHGVTTALRHTLAADTG